MTTRRSARASHTMSAAVIRRATTRSYNRNRSTITTTTTITITCTTTFSSSNSINNSSSNSSSNRRKTNAAIVPTSRSRVTTCPRTRSPLGIRWALPQVRVPFRRALYGTTDFVVPDGPFDKSKFSIRSTRFLPCPSFMFP